MSTGSRLVMGGALFVGSLHVYEGTFLGPDACQTNAEEVSKNSTDPTVIDLGRVGVYCTIKLIDEIGAPIRVVNAIFKHKDKSAPEQVVSASQESQMEAHFPRTESNQEFAATVTGFMELGAPRYNPSEDARSKFESQIPKIKALEHIYKEAEGQTGVPWYVLAAMDYRENGNDPSRSSCAGEKLGQVCIDQGKTIADDKLESLVWTADHAKYYFRKITGRDYQPSDNIEDIVILFIGHARGTAPQLPTMYDKVNFSYMAAFIDKNHDYMLWENNEKLNPHEGSRGKPTKQLGMIMFILAMKEYQLV